MSKGKESIPYRKDFDAWQPLKKTIHRKDKSDIPYFSNREIWFCHVGCNIGYEQDGTSNLFWRPVLIVKKYNAYLFTGIPLTSQLKSLPFYFDIGVVDEIPAMAILSQMKPFSSKRLIEKIGMLPKPRYEATKKAASEYIFGSPSDFSPS